MLPLVFAHRYFLHLCDNIQDCTHLLGLAIQHHFYNTPMVWRVAWWHLSLMLLTYDACICFFFSFCVSFVFVFVLFYFSFTSYNTIANYSVTFGFSYRYSHEFIHVPENVAYLPLLATRVASKTQDCRQGIWPTIRWIPFYRPKAWTKWQ